MFEKSGQSLLFATMYSLENNDIIFLGFQQLLIALFLMYIIIRAAHWACSDTLAEGLAQMVEFYDF